MSIEASGGITPQFDSEVRNLTRNTPQKEVNVVLTTLRNLSPTSIDKAPKHWRALLHHIHQQRPEERSQLVEAVAQILQEGIFERVSQAPLQEIVGKFSPRSRGRFAQTSKAGKAAVHAWRVRERPEFLADPRISYLLPYFCPTKLDPSHPETFAQVQRELAEILTTDLNGLIQRSPLLSDKEKYLLLAGSFDEILQNPTRLAYILTTAYNLSLVTMTPGAILKQIPNWNELTTLDQKARALKEELPKHAEPLSISLRSHPDYEKRGKKATVTCIPKEICELKGLQLLDLSYQYVRVIPPELEQRKNEVRLQLTGNPVAHIRR